MLLMSIPHVTNGDAKADIPCITVLTSNLPPVFPRLGAVQM